MKHYIVNLMTTIVLVALVIAIVILTPLAVIWALNTLFNLGIAYNFWTWLAMAVLTGTFGKTDYVKNRKN
jgi:hypothetical protein